MYTFHVLENSSKSIPRNASYPLFILVWDNWDDFSSKTSFRLHYHESRNNYFKVGEVKIMHVEEYKTLNIIPRSFTELDESLFCSVGQSLEFYSTLKNQFGKNSQSILDALNDASTNQGLADKFENYSSFKKSLIRYSEAEKAYKLARKLMNGQPLEPSYEFSYECKIGNAEKNHKVHFNFVKEDKLPHRIIGLVGKNGTGKTQYLSQLAVDLSGQRRVNVDENLFQPSRPLFTKVIAVSYSAFDKFIRPKKDKSFSYKYCGLKDDKGYLNHKRLIEIYAESVQTIKSLGRAYQWEDILGSIIQSELLEMFYDELFEKENFQIFEEKGQNLLSSGQSILMYVVTEILANVKEESLVLFDEPEMHLHPNAIANFIRMLHRLLHYHQSYAVVATHSPIILQEIPSKYVHVFNRYGNTPSIEPLGIESFGENISTITQYVFNTIEVKGTFKDHLEKLAKDHTYEEVLELFDNDLSFNASTYLKGIYNRDNEESN